MKKKKKWSKIALCVVVIMILAWGCGAFRTSDTKEVVPNEDLSTNTNSDEVEEVAETKEAITIDEQILVDQNGIVISAKEYVVDSLWGEGVKLLVENNSTQNLTVSCAALIVNDHMIMDLFVSDVAPGKKANETMYLSSSELKAAGIDVVGKIEVYFRVYDSDTYEETFKTEAVTIQTSEYNKMDTTANDVGQELYNENGIRIVGKTVDENSFWGTAILLYIENSSDVNVLVQCDNMSINGFMMTPYFSSNVYSGKKAVSDITIMSSELETSGIESIQEVELQFNILNEDTFETIAKSAPITFSAQ